MGSLIVRTPLTRGPRHRRNLWDPVAHLGPVKDFPRPSNRKQRDLHRGLSRLPLCARIPRRLKNRARDLGSQLACICSLCGERVADK